MSEPATRRKHNDASKTQALRLARESHSARTARQLSISEKLLYRWQQRIIGR